MSALFFAVLGLVLFIGRREASEILANLMKRFLS